MRSTTSVTVRFATEGILAVASASHRSIDLRTGSGNRYHFLPGFVQPTSFSKCRFSPAKQLREISFSRLSLPDTTLRFCVQPETTRSASISGRMPALPRLTVPSVSRDPKSRKLSDRRNSLYDSALRLSTDAELCSPRPFKRQAAG